LLYHDRQIMSIFLFIYLILSISKRLRRKQFIILLPLLKIDQVLTPINIIAFFSYLSNSFFIIFLYSFSKDFLSNIYRMITDSLKVTNNINKYNTCRRVT